MRVTFALGVGLAGLWWGLTVGLTITTIISVVELVKVDWPREVVKARSAPRRETRRRR